MATLFAVPSCGGLLRKYFALPLIAAMLFAFTGLSPAAASSGSDAGRLAVHHTAMAGLDIAFVGNEVQILGEVAPAVPTTKLPTGSVTLLPDKGNTPLDSVAILPYGDIPGGYAMYAPPQGAGTHYFRAAYSGDANFAPKSVRFAVTVYTGPDTKSTLMVSPSGTSTAGQPVKFTAQVSALTGPLTFRPVGSVSFLIDGISVADVSLEDESGWRASFTTSALSTGMHVITAEFVDILGNFSSSTSLPVTHTVVSALAEVRTEIHSSHHGDIPLGQAVKAQAVIAPRIAGQQTPTGWVQFYDWNTKVGAPVKLVNGKASFKYTGLTLGKHVLNAKYLGSSSYAPRDTPARTVNVRR